MKFRSIFACFAALSAFATLSCTSEDGKRPSESEEYLGLVEPDNGFMVRNLGAPIPPGADVEYCEVAELPGDPSDTYYVRTMEFGNAPQSHHLIITAAEPGSESDANLRELDIGDRVPCLSAEGAFGQDGMENVGGTQQRKGVIEFPEGVGREYHGGQRVVFDYHYYNTTTEEVQAKSAFTFHLADADQVQHIARPFGFYNWTIDIPVGQTATFRGECKFKNDVIISGITRHTHRWGTDYSVWFEGGARHGEHIWTSTDFQHDVDHSFDEPFSMKAGEGFKFECNYNNTLDTPLRFGTSATDEMCILFGLVWNAGQERDIASQSCDLVWTDAEGVAHDTSASGFPAPAPEDVELCMLGASSADGGAPDECTTCQCSACASVLITCGLDPHCSAILSCVRDTTQDCTSVIDEHSSAVGLLMQVRECTQSSGCTACTP